MKTRIANYLRAGYPALYLVSHEEARIERLCMEVATETERHLFAWSVSKGRQDLATGAFEAIQDPMDLLDTVASMPENSFILLRDFHYFLGADYPMYAVLVRKFKDAILHAKSRGICLVILGAELKIPDDLKKSITPLDFDLPDRETLGRVLDDIHTSNELPLLAGEARTEILVAASGLTTHEAEDAFSLSLVETGAVDPGIIQREKTNTIKNNGLLEVINLPVTLDDIGGLDNLKAWFLENRNVFTDAAALYGAEPPNGVLFCGQPGTGKSLCAKAVGSVFRCTVLNLEAGKLFGSLVGQSEGNWRSAHKTAKAVRPCIMWIDEIDGLFAGHGGQSNDGGTSERVHKAILQDMQNDSEGIFYVFTANDIDKIPAPLIDRVMLWSVDLPNPTERLAIWRIHIAKLRAKQTVPWNPDDFALADLVQDSEGFSGRQIERVWREALKRAFNEARPPTTEDVIAVLDVTVPTSKSMAKEIEARRARLQGKATPASDDLADALARPATPTRKITRK